MAKERKRCQGLFAVEGDEPKAQKPIQCKLPESLDREFREYVQAQNSNITEVLTAWVREKLAESKG
ncbi:MAG: hypothetical protein HC799_19055 [Limnothrix sp. RL_2_0]|nr:hypothetical protein [Limnothrix sp. RL_2_0]